MMTIDERQKTNVVWRPAGRILLSIVFCLIAPAAAQDAAPPPPLELRTSSPPRDAAEASAARNELAREFERLSPTTRPATSQPTTAPDAEPAAQLDAWRIELWRALHTWDDALA